MLDTLIQRLGSDVEQAITNATDEISGGPYTGPTEIRYGRAAGVIWDPTLTETGFVLQITAETDEGFLEASFNAWGELRRGLVGGRIKEDTEGLIRRWRAAAGPAPAVALGVGDY